MQLIKKKKNMTQDNLRNPDIFDLGSINKVHSIFFNSEDLNFSTKLIMN